MSSTGGFVSNSSSSARRDENQLPELVRQHHRENDPAPRYLSTGKYPAVQPEAKAFQPRHKPVSIKKGQGWLTEIVVMVILAGAFGGMAWHGCKSADKSHSHRIR